MRPGCLILTATILRSSIKASRRQNIVHQGGATSCWLSSSPHLEQQAIPRAAISDGTNRFSFVNTPGEFELDSGCFIEGFQLFGGEFQIQTAEIVLELRYLPRSNDRDYRHRLVAQPRERDLRHASTNLL